MSFHELVQIWVPVAEKLKKTDQLNQVQVTAAAIRRAISVNG